MPKIALTQARIKALKSRKTAYGLRDGKLRGFGVRVLPSGRKHFFVDCQHRGERVWKALGDTERVSVADARSCAAAMLTAIRRGQRAPARPDEARFETVAETVFGRYERVWKARTLYVNRSYLRRQLLPHFSGRQIADIDGQDVRNWFASLRGTPVAADRSMPVLSVIMREAEAMGLRPQGSNPCKGIRRYRRKGRERFLSNDETRRLSAELLAHAVGDSKVGPRKAPLSTQARRILERQPRGGSAFVFSSPLDPTRPRGPDLRLWYRVRQQAGIEDVRLHDLRHTHASHAVMNGVPVPVVSQLLGHKNVRMTLRYAHLADREIEAAAERVGQGIAAIMDM